MATAANVVKFKRSAVAGKVPATTDLALGEIALNTYDGRIYLKKSVASTESVVALQPFPSGGTTGQILSLDSYGNLIWVTSGVTSSGTVTSVSVVSTNGFAGTVATSTTTPAITIQTTVTGLLKGNGTAISAATAGTDYISPSTTGQTITDTSGGTNYTLKIANGTTGAVFGFGTGSNAYGIANDALNNTISGYVPYTVSASSITFKAGASSPATALSIASDGTVAIGTLTGLLKGTSGVISTATAGTDYLVYGSLSTGTPNSASGTGAISYNNTTGVFTYTPPDLSSYVTSTSLTSTLSSYVTSSSLSSTLSSYVTSTSLTSTLSSYVTSTSLSSTLSSYVTSSTLSGYNYITLTSLSMDTPGSASGSGSVAYSNTTGKFKYTPPDLSSYITASVTALTSLTSIGATGVDTTTNGNLIVSGNLTVNGTTETINATTSTFADKNIELAKPVSPATASDTSANGGGITLHGTTDKTLNWVLSTTAWTSSENVDLASGKAYKINGTDVLSSTALGSAVTGSSLTSVGTITSGTWNGTAIANSYLVNTTIQLNGVTLTLGDTGKTIKASTTNALTIGTGLSGSSFDGSSAVTIALATGYGDTQNPYASKTAKYVLAAPNSTSGAPTFRLLVASDIPTLNQDTTGNAGTVTNGVYTTGSYANPTWLTSLAYSKLTGAPTNVSTFTNDAAYITTGSLSISTNSPGTESLSYSAGVFTFTPYSLPIATSSRLGGVKAGTGVTIAADGTISSTGGAGGTSPTSASFDLWASILIMGS